MNKLLVNNFLYNLIYQCLNVLTPLITAPYIARILGAEGVGIYSYTYTVVLVFALFAALGTSSYGQREIARNRDSAEERSAVFWELAILRLITTLVVGVAYLLLCFAYREYTVYLLQQSFILWMGLLDFTWFFQGIEDFKIVVLRNCTVKVAYVVLVFLLVTDPSHTGRYIMINSVTSMVSVLLFLPALKGRVRHVPLVQLQIKRHLRGMIEFFIPLIATQIYAQLDKIMLGAISPDIIQNGYYEQSRKIVMILVALLTTINTVMFPRITNLHAHGDKKQIMHMYGVTFRLILLLLLPIVVGLWVVADNFALWFFGAEFAPVSELLKYSGLLLIFISVGNFVGMQYLGPTGRQNQMTVIYLLAAAINIVLNVCLIPQLLALGAVIASVLAEGFSCLAQVWLLKKGEYSFFLGKDLHKYALAAGAMGLVLQMLHWLSGYAGPAATLLDIFVGAIVYFTVLFFMREELVRVVLDRMLVKTGQL